MPSNFSIFKEDEHLPKKVVKNNGEIRSKESPKLVDRKYGYIFYKSGETYRGMIHKSKQNGLGELVSKDESIVQRSKFGQRMKHDVHVLKTDAEEQVI